MWRELIHIKKAKDKKNRKKIIKLIVLVFLSGFSCYYFLFMEPANNCNNPLNNIDAIRREVPYRLLWTECLGEGYLKSALDIEIDSAKKNVYIMGEDQAEIVPEGCNEHLYRSKARRVYLLKYNENLRTESQIFWELDEFSACFPQRLIINPEKDKIYISGFAVGCSYHPAGYCKDYFFVVFNTSLHPQCSRTEKLRAGSVRYVYPNIVTNSHHSIYEVLRQSSGSIDIRKYTTSGFLIWREILGVNSLQVTSVASHDKYLYISFRGFQAENGLFGEGEVEFTEDLVKISTNGKIIWHKFWIERELWYSEKAALLPDSRGNLYYLVDKVIKFNLDGEIVWSIPKYSARKLFVDSHDNLYLLGKDLLKFNPEGHMIWNFSNTKSISDIAIDEEDNIYMLSFSEGKVVLRKYEYCSDWLRCVGSSIYNVLWIVFVNGLIICVFILILVIVLLEIRNLTSQNF